MPYNSGQTRPSITGQNYDEVEILLVSENTLDSVAPSDPTAFVTAKTNQTMFRPAAVYDTGVWTIAAGEIKVTNTGPLPRSSKFIVSGTILSDSQINDGSITVRLSSSTGLLTGTTKIYPAGITSGTSTIAVGFTTIGFATLQPNESVTLEVSKNFSGTLVLSSLLASVTPLW